MLSFGRSLSTRLYLQAALTVLLAPSAHGAMWFVLMFAVAGGAFAVAWILQSDDSRTRQLVIGFESFALAVTAVGFVGHHYIPGTIVGVVTLMTVLNDTGATNAPRVYLPATVMPYPDAVIAEPVAAETSAAEPVFAPADVLAAVPVQHTPVYAEPVPIRAAAEILPGRRR